MGLRDCASRIWDGFLQHVGVTLFVLTTSAVYLVLKEVKRIRDVVRAIPTDWVLTPLVFLVIGVVALVIINRKQRQRISTLEREPTKDERDARMVTHSGVWWKIYPRAEYIEDYPYCTCCDPRKKLSQTEWYPNEVFQCPTTRAPFKLFGDDIPMRRTEILDRLYRTYFDGLGRRVEREFNAERRRLKELNKDMSDADLFDKLFQLPPLNRIPKKELKEIQDKYPHPNRAFDFIDRHFSRYKKYFRGEDPS